MANIQKQFEAFNDEIKLKRFEENAILREKRDIIRNKLNDKLPEVFENHGENCPVFEFRDQGSYEIGTGIKPIEGDYDIDQGLYFQVTIDTYPDPVDLKKRVHEALNGHTDKVCIRRSCVTVFYHQDNEAIYHVDIAVYSDSSKNADGKSRIAKGKENSSDEYRYWEVSDPQALTNLILARFTGNDRAQFRRVVQDLKRWKDDNFDADGNAAPLGIGLTVAAYYNLQATYTDRVAGKANDLKAIMELVRSILSQFSLVWDASEKKFVKRLVIKLPVEPWNDLFEKMTNKQAENLEIKLQSLLEALCAADQAVDPVDACTELQKVFGDDFPIPEPADTAKRHQPAIVSSSNSA
jgi:hypothetical protein